VKSLAFEANGTEHPVTVEQGWGRFIADLQARNLQPSTIRKYRLLEKQSKEIGVRMALGAGRRDILDMILRNTTLLLGAGLLLGIPLSYAASRAISSQLFGLGPGDISPFLAAVAMLSVVMALAAFLPARRATRVDPMVALRHEQTYSDDVKVPFA
jgi:predicted lysophospholipase L1 biosynthesis ABC-type transport system permease subunit